MPTRVVIKERLICTKCANQCFGRGQNNAFAYVRLDKPFARTQGLLTEPDGGEPHPLPGVRRRGAADMADERKEIDKSNPKANIA